MPSFLSFLSSPVSDFVSKVGNTVKQFVTTDKDRADHEQAMAALVAEFQEKMEAASTQFAGMQRDVIVAEAGADSWLAKNWRPITMLVFTFIIFWNFVIVPIFGATPVLVPDKMWDLLEVGIGGYIGARTVEKVGPDLIAALASLKK